VEKPFLAARVGVSILAAMVAGAAALPSGQASAAGTTKTRPVSSTQSATTVAKGTTAGTASGKGTSAKAGSAKKGGQVLQPGKPLVGWELRGPTDWPAANEALVAEPVDKTILVRQSPDFSTPGIALRSGGSVSGKLGLLIVGESNGWWKVLMPVRPNGTVGWVQRTSVKTRVITERVVVDLAANTITIYKSGKIVRTEAAATGTSGTPTPDGLYFVKAIVAQSNPNAGRGPFVLVLSAFSEVLNTFDGGQGAVGIHGTGSPSKIGQKVSHGCVRVRNQTIIEMAGSMRPGTPVEILARASDAPATRWTPPTDAGDASSDAAGAGTTSVPSAANSGNSGGTNGDTNGGPDGSGVGSAQPPITGVS
jgi:lipoprotein-anchoring transpeptidase ErfK/SrfK